MAAILAKASVTRPLGVLLQALVDLATRPMYLGDNNSNPCSHFIQDGMRIGGIEAWVKKIVGNSGGEYRLNGAGLKLYVTISHTGSQALVSIGGDQVDMYLDFVTAARDAIVKLRLDHESYFKEV